MGGEGGRLGLRGGGGWRWEWRGGGGGLGCGWREGGKLL